MPLYPHTTIVSSALFLQNLALSLQLKTKIPSTACYNSAHPPGIDFILGLNHVVLPGYVKQYKYAGYDVSSFTAGSDGIDSEPSSTDPAARLTHFVSP